MEAVWGRMEVVGKCNADDGCGLRAIPAGESARGDPPRHFELSRRFPLPHTRPAQPLAPCLGFPCRTLTAVHRDDGTVVLREAAQPGRGILGRWAVEGGLVHLRLLHGGGDAWGKRGRSVTPRHPPRDPKGPGAAASLARGWGARSWGTLGTGRAWGEGVHGCPLGTPQGGGGGT